MEVQFMTLLQEIYKLTSNRRRLYFLWKHKLQNNRTDYGSWTKEELINKYFKGSEEAFQRMELWEKSDEYARLVNIMLKERMSGDFLEIYNSVSEKAKQGDEKAIKTFLMLQKEIKNNLKFYEKNLTTNNEIDEDDDLILE